MSRNAGCKPNEPTLWAVNEVKRGRGLVGPLSTNRNGLAACCRLESRAHRAREIPLVNADYQ